MAQKKQAHVRASTCVRTNADALIAAASRGQSTVSDPTPDAIAELEKLIAYNDAAPWKSKVTAAQAVELLRGFGWNGGVPALNTLCRRRFGRRTYAQA